MFGKTKHFPNEISLSTQWFHGPRLGVCLQSVGENSFCRWCFSSSTGEGSRLLLPRVWSMDQQLQHCLGQICFRAHSREQSLGSRGPGGSCPRNTQKRGGTSSHCHCGTDYVPSALSPLPTGMCSSLPPEKCRNCPGKREIIQDTSVSYFNTFLSKIKSSLFCTSHAHG